MTALEVPCDVCGTVIEEGVAHCPHERGCGAEGCGCASVTCWVCCHECNPLVAS